MTLPCTCSQMTEKTLNNCFLLHVAKEFIQNTHEHVMYFGNFQF